MTPKHADKATERPFSVEIEENRVKVTPSYQIMQEIVSEDKTQEEDFSIGLIVFAAMVLMGVIALLVAIC